MSKAGMVPIQNPTSRIQDWPRRRRCIAAALALAAVVVVAAVWALIPPFRGNLDDFGAGTRILDRRGRPLREVLGEGDRLCAPVPLARCGDWTARALVAAEDKRFYRHGGVDVLAVCRAAWCNTVCGRVVSGASTLSMLVGKLCEPRPRTLWTKLVEARHARELEGRLSKDDILEQYLNRAPFGGHVVGVEAAARRYFDKSAADLTLAEAALLVGLPQAPARLRPDQHPGPAVVRRDYVLAQMRARGFITEAQRRAAARQPPALARAARPFRAPHFCDAVAARYAVDNTAPSRLGVLPSGPGEGRGRSTKDAKAQRGITTTLDLDIQTAAEQALRAGMADLRRAGVRGGAVVVLDVRRGAVRAMVGSPDYASDADSGQVNAALRPRSPGSALKPFVYAMAIDEGLCAPETVVEDAPATFAGYRPRNFDRDYAGPVPVRAALVQSLNIPALRFAQRLGLEPVVRRLRALGLSTLDQPAERYGLSIAVGTCEVTLLDLANAYACLARLGVYRDAAWLEREPVAPGARLFSPEAAWLVADMLSGDERSLDGWGHVADAALPRVAWKTGTSSGQRDAWCLAWNPEYVVGVWIGNPDGRASPALVGAGAAAPVAHQVFRRLYPAGRAPWFVRPAGLATRPVCAVSGLPPGPGCAVTLAADYIPGITAPAPCAGHGLAGIGTDAAGRAPRTRIVAPAAGETFRLDADARHLAQSIALRAQAADAAGDLHWFVDRRFLARAAPGATVLWPLQPGPHLIACSDAQGRGDSVRIVVE